VRHARQLYVVDEARGGPRPIQPADQRYESASLFGAMQRHVDGITPHVARGAHAVLLLDRAGWHTTGNLVWPKKVTPILLPSRSSEFSPVEQVWQYLRANCLQLYLRQLRRHHRRCCDAWRNLSPSRSRSHRSECGPWRMRVICEGR